MKFPVLAAASLAACVTLTACGSQPSSDAPSATETTAAAAVESTTASVESSTTASAQTQAETEPSAAAAASSSAAADLKDKVAQAYEIFAPIASLDLFSRFNSCDPAGLDDSFNCSGPEVGQVQFFKSESKAAQTTQVLTELRSSRVLEDNGNRVVGWSTLGTTAVLTVVDNRKGLVMQQMISTDQDNPQDKLRELGALKEES